MNFKILAFLLIFAVFASKNHVYGGTATCKYMPPSARMWVGYRCDPMTMSTPEVAESVTEIIGDHLPDENDDHVLQLIGVNMTFRTVTSIFCEKFKTLHKLDISQSKVEEIDENSLENCENLSEISFKSNNIRHVPEKLFSKNSRLFSINFSDNQLTTLPENLFVNIDKLGIVNFINNKITSLPAKIFDAAAGLFAIHMNNNRLTSINPEWFENLRKLEVLSLDSNQIADLPKNVFLNAQNLESLSIKSNRLTVIHGDSFGNNKKFKRLNAVNNNIYAIDESFIDNTGLVMLFMRGNLCSQSNVDYGRSILKRTFKNCFEDYKSRDEI